MHYDVLIVGAGHAGAHAAIMLRQLGFDGSIALLGEEPDLPYERPPLSKDYLAGEKSREALALRHAHFWLERKIDLIPGETIVAVDAATHIASAASGKAVVYRQLIWAAARDRS